MAVFLLLEGWEGPWDGPNCSLFVGAAGAASHLPLKARLANAFSCSCASSRAYVTSE